MDSSHVARSAGAASDRGSAAVIGSPERHVFMNMSSETSLQ